MICNYVDQKGSAAVLTSVQSAGITLEVNLSNPLHTGKEVHKQESALAFETQDRLHQKFKTAASVAPQKRLASCKTL